MTDKTKDASEPPLDCRVRRCYMTTAELADAIASAWKMQHQTGRMSANHGDITAHLAELLKIQQDRARLVPNTQFQRTGEKPPAPEFKR